jgi:Flp pilus assembly protein TadD
MSLLLDALKKSGHSANANKDGNGQPEAKPELSLEEPTADQSAAPTPEQPPAAQPTPEQSGGLTLEETTTEHAMPEQPGGLTLETTEAEQSAAPTPEHPPAEPATRLSMEAPPPRPAPAISKSDPGRNAGKNLFAAKKPAPAKKKKREGIKMKLGIVPVTFIACSVIGAVYGGYVWWEIHPHSHPRPHVTHAAPPPAAPAPAPQNIARNAAPTLKPIEPIKPAQPSNLAQSIETGPAKVSSAQAAPAQSPAKPSVATRHHRHAPREARETQTFTIQKVQQADTITPLLDSGYRAYRNGDFAVAQQDYSQVLRLDGNNRDALLGMAAIAQQQGNDTAATQYYGQVLTLDPRDPVAQAGMSALEKGSSATDRESRLKLMLDQHPQSAALNFALGNLYAEQSRWTEAQQAYFAAYSLQPDAAQYAYNLAISLDHLGQGKLAAQYYQRALQLDSSASATIDHAQAQQRLNELLAH